MVFDQTMTDTARYADVVLPATTFLEHYDLPRGYGPISLRLGTPVIEPVGESRSNADVFGDLLRAAGSGAGGRPEGRAGGDAGRAVAGAGSRRRRAARRTAWPPRPTAAGRFSSSTCSRGRPTGRCDLFPAAPRRRIARPVSTAISPTRPRRSIPLALISPASDRTISSTLAELPRPEVRLLMHPDDARPARHRRRRRRPHLQPARRGALPRAGGDVDPARHGAAAQGPLAQAHRQRLTPPLRSHPTR